jgi:hypothetical protein
MIQYEGKETKESKHLHSPCSNYRVLIIWSVITNWIVGQSRVIRKFELDKIINFSSVAWMYPPTPDAQNN